MDRRSQELLEFPIIRDRLAGLTAFGPSRRLAEALEPSAEPALVSRWLDETDEARAFLAEHPGSGIGGARDIGPSIERAARGGRLDPSALLDIQGTLEAADQLRRGLAEERRPRLHELARQVETLPALRTTIERSIDPTGELLDSASPRLGGLRRAVRVAYERLRGRLDQLVHGGELASALQEPIITLRNGRYVVPVRSEARGRVRGIVHDQSSSGQTVFVEPLVVVELGNAWREAQLAEQAEIERILDEISALVGAQAIGLRATLEALARFDFWMARARLAEEMDAVRVETVGRGAPPPAAGGGAGEAVGRDAGPSARARTGASVTDGAALARPPSASSTGGAAVSPPPSASSTGGVAASRPPAAPSATLVELLGARHPGLRGRVVPIDVRLGGEFTALVVTGPNTGGKTVTLRTIGLLALMHQAGLHVPALPGSRLPVFRDVFADIGDEQSVAQSLSTFSSHLRSIVRIVEAAGPDTLVLLDELGAGTDPTEGSALAQALLDHFIRSGALIAATTHYAELKIYAHNTPGASNASVDFDLETLSPTYHVTIGLPGTSQAFAIAERLGLGPDLVQDARARLSRAQLEFEATLASIKVQQREAEEALERAVQAEARAREMRREAEQERARTRREEAERLAAASAEAQRLLEDLRAEVDSARRALERETLTAGRLDALAQQLGEREAALPGVAAEAPAPSPPAGWATGMLARSRRGGWIGRIAAIDRARSRVTLEAGAMRIEAELDDLEVPPPGSSALGTRGAGTTRPRSGRRGEFGVPETVGSGGGRGSGTGVSSRALVPRALDVRGARVDEALELVDHYLDDASVAQAGQVTIIHGHGSGALRDAVRSLLASHPLVRSWRPGERGEGGDGATVVKV